MKDKNIAVRVTWETWSLLERIRAERELNARHKITLSDIVREALETHAGNHDDKQQPDN